MASQIWVPSKSEAWVPGTVLTNEGNSLTVSIKSLTGIDNIKIPGPLNKYDIITSGSLDQDCDNLVDLESYSEGIILHHIKKRFQNNVIYTFVGNILVALNPYKSIDLYRQDIMDKIHKNVLKSDNIIEPHVYSIAAISLKNMKEDNKDQCVLISGESGAGKTEATKRILQYISTMSKSSASRTNISIENQILDSNPILESFGNAKTTRNNNSSRFEKSRVVKCSKNERNYHIFYMLCAGANSELKQELYLKNSDQFFYLTQGNVIEIKNRSDEYEFQQLLDALKNLNIDNNLIKQIFQCLASILHLGNVQFSPNSNNNDGDGSKILNSNDCIKISQLLGLTSNILENTLCYRENIVNKEIFSIPIPPNKAIEQRDALSKYIYQRIFDIIISTVNTTLYRGKFNNNISVLDIFGFEVFELNSFEQLCINYCNERLQTFFNIIIFENEMKMYALDGVNCEDITYQDNIGCLRLIDLKGNGIFSLLDEQGIIPQGTDEKFLLKINQLFHTKNNYYNFNHKKVNEFIIRHFAGDVSYNVTNFINKNQDILPNSVIKLINSSNISFIRYNNDVNNSNIENKSNKLTLCNKFKIDLDTLMNTLQSTTPQFIRCIKSNDLQLPNTFEPIVVLNQLKYSGLFEAIKIRKAGYSIRLPHLSFIYRYKHCCNPRLSNDLLKTNPKLYCQQLITSIYSNIEKNGLLNNSDKQPWAIGNTKIYIRNQEFKLLLDHERYICATKLINKIQAIIRGFLARIKVNKILGINRKQLLKERKNQLLELERMKREEIISYNNEIIFRNDYELQQKLLEAKKLKILLEKEKKLKKLINNCIIIQRYVRGFLGRLKGKIFMCEKVFDEAIKSKNKYQLNYSISFYNKQKNPKSKLILVYKQHIKSLLLSIYQEDYVLDQLQDGLISNDMNFIQQIIDLTNKYNMSYLKEYQKLLDRLNQLKNIDSIKINLRNCLNQCININKLISYSDQLEKLVQQGLANGLAREEDIHLAIDKLINIQSLLELRHDMRISVEICSESRMKRLLKKRNDLSRIYGQEFLQDEYQAIIGLLRMFEYDIQLSTQYQVQYNLSNDVNNEIDDKIDSKIDNKIDNKEDNKKDNKIDKGYDSIIVIDNNGDDIKLPPFVKEILDEMRNSKSSDEFNKAIQKFILLVPMERKRRIYLRLYKWMVSFCIWGYDKSESEIKAHIQQMKLIEMNQENDNIKNILYTTEFSEMPQFNELGRKTTVEVKSKLSSSYEFIDKPTGLASTVSKGYKFASSSSSSTPNKSTSPTKTMNSSTLSPTKTNTTSLSPTKVNTTTATTPSPFSFKAATKSDITAHNAIKKAKELNKSAKKSAADRKIEEAILEYERFYGKHRLDPRQWR